MTVTSGSSRLRRAASSIAGSVSAPMKSARIPASRLRRTHAARVRTLPGRVRKAVVQSRLQCGVGRFLHGEDGRPLQQLRLAPHFCAAGFRVDGHDGNTILERKHHAVQPRCHHGIHARQQRLDSGGISESSAVFVQPRVDCDPNHVLLEATRRSIAASASFTEAES